MKENHSEHGRPSQVSKDKHKSLSDHAVCKKLGICTFLTHLRYNTLKFFQGLLKQPDRHELVLSALFGKYVFNEEAKTTPWLDVLYDDFQHLNQFEEIAELNTEMEKGRRCEGGLVLRALVLDDDMRSEFIKTAYFSPSCKVSRAICIFLSNSPGGAIPGRGE